MNRSIASRRSSIYRSSIESEWSEDRFSIKEINELIRIVMDKEKDESKNNIVLKDAKLERNLKERVLKFIKHNIDFECKILHCRLSGKVVIVKLGISEEKKEIMSRKNKLAEERGKRGKTKKDKCMGKSAKGKRQQYINRF